MYYIVEVSRALYYGLFTDTGSLTEIVHPLDRDLRDEANFDPAIMRKLRNANLSLEELQKTMDPAKYVGRAPIQVDVYLKNVVNPVLEANKDILGVTAEINV